MRESGAQGPFGNFLSQHTDRDKAFPFHFGQGPPDGMVLILSTRAKFKHIPQHQPFSSCHRDLGKRPDGRQHADGVGIVGIVDKDKPPRRLALPAHRRRHIARECLRNGLPGYSLTAGHGNGQQGIMPVMLARHREPEPVSSPIHPVGDVAVTRDPVVLKQFIIRRCIPA